MGILPPKIDTNSVRNTRRKIWTRCCKPADLIFETRFFYPPLPVPHLPTTYHNILLMGEYLFACLTPGERNSTNKLHRRQRKFRNLDRKCDPPFSAILTRSPSYSVLHLHIRPASFHSTNHIVTSLLHLCLFSLKPTLSIAVSSGQVSPRYEDHFNQPE